MLLRYVRADVTTSRPEASRAECHDRCRSFIVRESVIGFLPFQKNSSGSAGILEVRSIHLMKLWFRSERSNNLNTTKPKDLIIIIRWIHIMKSPRHIYHNLNSIIYSLKIQIIKFSLWGFGVLLLLVVVVGVLLHALPCPRPARIRIIRDTLNKKGCTKTLMHKSSQQTLNEQSSQQQNNTQI